MKKKGMTLVEIILVSGITALLIAIAIPNIITMRERVRRDMCINNLRQIKLAKEQWALENNKDSSDEPSSDDISTYIKDGADSLKCPNDSSSTFGTSYTIENIGSDPQCKISSSTHHL